MATIDTTITLGGLVNEHPELARELEQRGLDYCCGGRQTLAEACTKAGLNADSVASELQAAATATAALPDWTAMGAAELVDHLEATHHRYMWAELPRLSSLVPTVLAAHAANHPELETVAWCFGAMRADLEPHLLKEERILFPMIRELAVSTTAPSFHCGTLRNPISVMMREHETVGELLARLRRATRDYQPPADACASYEALYRALAEMEADIHLHIHKENNVLFPLVIQLEDERAPRSSEGRG